MHPGIQRDCPIVSDKVTYAFAEFELDPSRMVLRRDGETVKLEPQVFRLLLLLVENHHRIVPREEINTVIWRGRHVSDSALASRLRTARNAIGDNGSDQRLIRTIPNTGVRFVGEVTTVSPEAEPIPLKRVSWLKRYGVHATGAATLICLIISAVWWGLTSSANAELETRFIRTPDAAISGYNNTRHFYVSRHDCMRACIKATEFVCRSFDYYNTESACDLSEETAASVGGLKTDYELPETYDHYERIFPEDYAD